MRIECTSCSRDFFDDADNLPQSRRVHCVFCGAPIDLPELVPPFSSDFEREEGFALGVLSGGGGGFPDTLRQFRVRARQRTSLESTNGDSLAPLIHDPDAASPERAPHRSRPFWLSLGGGFAVGGMLAFLANWPRGSVEPQPARARAAAPHAVLAEGTRLGVGCPVTRSAPSVAPATSGASVKLTPELQRSWLLEQARSLQRRYHLAGAERTYRAVLRQAPGNSEALAGLGEVELLRGAPEHATDRFLDVLAVNADYVPALIAVADIEWQAGQTEQAREKYRAIVEQYSEDLYPPYVEQRSLADTTAK